MSHSSDFGATGGRSDEPTRAYPGNTYPESADASYGTNPPNASSSGYGASGYGTGAPNGYGSDAYGAGAGNGYGTGAASAYGAGAANSYGTGATGAYGTGAPNGYADTAYAGAAGGGYSASAAGQYRPGQVNQYQAPAPVQQAQNPYQPQSYVNYAPVPTNTLSIVAMVLSLAGFFSGGVTAIAGIICGHIARRQIQQSGENGDGMALTGLIVGYIIAVPTVLFWIFYILFLIGVVGLGIFGATTS